MVKFPYRPDSQLKCIEGSNLFHETTTKENVQSKSLNSNFFTKTNQQNENENQSLPKTKKSKVGRQRKNLIDDAKTQDTFDEQKPIDFKQSLESKDKPSKKKCFLKENINDVIEPPLVSLSDIKKRLKFF